MPASGSARWQPRSSAALALQVTGGLVAAALVIARRPDAITHAQFWAEDGRVFYANVYNHGPWATLATPQAGYFVTFATLAAWLSQVVSLVHAPLVTNLAALGAQVLPVVLILSRRAERYAPDVRLRVLFALLYLLVIHAPEVDLTAVNAQWHLAVAGLLVVIAAPPTHRWQQVTDGAILVVVAITGPFCIVLLPLAVWQRRVRGAESVANWRLGVLAAGAALQLLSLVGVFGSVGGALFEPKPPVDVHLTLSLISKIFAGRVLAGTVIGEVNGVTLSGVVHGLVLLAGVLAFIHVLLTRPVEIRCALLYAAALLVLGTLRTVGTVQLAEPGADLRYFVIPDIGVMALLVCLLSRPSPLLVRGAAAAAIVAALITAFTNPWRDPPFARLPFPQQAAAFERARPGQTVTIPLNPGPPWLLVLVKHR